VLDEVWDVALCWWLTPLILVTQEQRSGESWLKASQANSSQDPIYKKPITKKKGLEEWLKV
jgi:hypothetical protein